MLETFNITLTQVVVLFSFMATGYFFMKKRLVPENSPSVISGLLVKLIMPLYTFRTFSENITLEKLRDKSVFIIAAVIILSFTFIIGTILGGKFSKSDRTREVYTYSFTIANYGYLGYPIVEAVFGAETLCNMMIFCIPYSVMVYTWGMYILNPAKKFTFRKLLNPSNVGMIIGIIVGLTGFNVPAFIAGAVKNEASSMSTLAMIMTGMVMGKQDIIKILKAPKAYIASLIRLVLLPMLIGVILLILNVRHDIVLVAIMTTAMPMGLNSVVFPEAFGGDSDTGAQVCLVSNLMGILTIPIIGMLASLL